MNQIVAKQIRLYYLSFFLIGTWFTSGVALFFSRRFLTDAQIGWMDAIVVGMGLIAEIPSGVIADRFGRRQTVIAGVVLMGAGFALWGLAAAGWMVFAGLALYTIGAALQSGADEAMMYDYLKANGQAQLWPRVSANVTIIARLAYVLAVAIGGLAFITHDRLPFLMRALTFFILVIPLAKLAVIDKFQDRSNQPATQTHFLKDLQQGIQELFQPQARWLIPLYILVQGMSYTVFTAGMLRPLLYEKSGLDVAYHSLAISISLVLTVLAMLGIRRIANPKTTPRLIFLLAGLCAVGFATSIGRLPIVLPLLGLTLLQIAAYALMPVLSTALNSSISSRYRATTLSAASFLQSIVYVLTAPLVGFLSLQGLINEVAVGTTLLVVLGILLSRLLKRSAASIYGDDLSVL